MNSSDESKNKGCVRRNRVYTVLAILSQAEIPPKLLSRFERRSVCRCHGPEDRL